METRKIFLPLLALLAMMFAVTQADGKTIYAATTGNDTNSGTLTSPVATPSKALELAASGDTIYLRAGTYTLTRFIWVAVPNITIASYPGERARIVGGTADVSGNPQSIFVIVSNNVTLSDLEIQGGSYYGVKVDLDSTSTTSGVVIRRCYIHHTGRDAIKTFNADNLVIEDCEIAFSGARDSSNAEGIDSIASVGVTIRRNYVHDTATTGIYIKGGVRNGVVERNRIVNPGHAGILLGQDTDLEFMRDGAQYEAINCIARNNIVINAGAAGIGTYSGDNVRFENNTLWDVAKTYNGGLYVAMNSRDVAARNVTFKNNIVVTTSSRPVVSLINMSGALTSDSNIFYRPSGSGYVFYREIWPSTANTWNSLSQWQAGMSADANSSTSNPALDAANMYKPASGSPAIDRGETLAEVPDDFAGASRPQGARHDIGAHEAAGSSTPPPPNQPPAVSATASATSGTAPVTVTLTATASDPDGQIVSYSWNFGDGTTASQSSISHTYQSAGSYTARVTVTDDKGATASASVVISVSAPANRPPTVSLAATPTSGAAPLSVRFTSTASDPDGQVVSYRWEFGDSQTSSEVNPSHTYQAGSFTARLTVTDNLGATASATIQINATDGSGTTRQNVVWQNVVGCAVNGNSLTKTAPTTWGNAGASSAQKILSGNGYLEFTAQETNNERMVGLSNTDADQTYITINYAIHLNTGRAFYVYESGTQRGYFGDFNTGDVFRVAVENGSVRYYRNGAVFYTSSVAPAYPLMADAALMGEGSTVSNAIMSGIEAAPAPPTAPVVKVLKPNTSETLTGGTVYTVMWSVTGTSLWRHDVQFSSDGGTTWKDVATLLPGTATSYQWTVPNIKTKAGRIRVISYGGGGLTGNDMSDAKFQITKIRIRSSNN
jgi:PKD repeat protein